MIARARKCSDHLHDLLNVTVLPLGATVSL